jgi:EAL domain-containing protein (putative c-di-GMP-specific phosphodiesterase class I)
MYRAKEKGKNNYVYYDASFANTSYETITIENELKSAIANKEFEVYYQPQILLENDTLIGLEALIRWNHPKHGVLLPGRFIPYAEESKMILAIGAFVVRQACLDLLALQKEFGFKGRVSVNVSGIQLEHDDFSTTLETILKETGVTPSSLELEITESVFMKDALRWISILEKLRRLGIKIAIDDFGTGYSSLSYLRRLPADKLKIDISFVRDVPHHEDAKAIAKAIIVLAKSMHMRTLAEGIETAQQAHFLKTEGCDEGQGYYFEKGLTFSALKAWIKKREET